MAWMSFWSKLQALAYWQSYVEHFGVVDYIRFSAEVVRVEAGDSETWQLRLASGERLRSKRLALALGNNSVPNYPAWRASLSEVASIHSMDYRNAQGFEGKNVLVVGGGESGSDVVLEISTVARQCRVSLRHHTGWVVSRRSSNPEQRYRPGRACPAEPGSRHRGDAEPENRSRDTHLGNFRDQDFGSAPGHCAPWL